MLGEKNRPKVAYIHGRPQSHPMQMKCAEAIEADFFPVDFKIRWHDKPNANKFLKYISWIVCTFTFPNVKKYDVFLSGGLHITMPLMRLFRVINKNQKIIVHLGDHTLYFLFSERYSKRVKKLFIWALKKYDAIIVEGKMGVEFAKVLLGNNLPPIYSVTSGIPNNHYYSNLNRQPNFLSKKILFMGDGPNANRMYYKGLDTTIEAFKIAYKKDNKIELVIVGNWDNYILQELLKNCEPNVAKNIHFVGHVKDLGLYLEDSILYLHCARGEAFGVTVLIAMLAGLIPIVSDLTGAKEVVEGLSKKLVVSLNPKMIAERIDWFFKLEEKEHRELSSKAKLIAEKFKEEIIVENYKSTFLKAYFEITQLT